MPTMVHPKARDWYRIVCQADASVAEIWIYDQIGEVMDWWTGEISGVGAKAFRDQLAALPATVKTIIVHLNSQGGNYFDAVAIANMLRDQNREKGRQIMMRIEALAASAASIVSSSGDVIQIASNAMVMIHGARSDTYAGNAQEHRSKADALESVEASMVATYRWHSPLSAEELNAMMQATTWMNAEEALANGFATEIIEPVAVSATFDPRSIQALGTIPEPYRDRVKALLAQGQPAPDLPAPSADPPLAAAAAAPELSPPDPAAASAPLSAQVGDAARGPDPAATGTPAAPAVVSAAAAAPAPGLGIRLAEPVAHVAASATEILAAVKTAALSVAFAQQLIEAKLPMTDVTARIAEATAIRGLCATAKYPELADGWIAARLSPAVVQAQLTIITAKKDGVEITTALPADGRNPTPVKAGTNSAEIYRQRAEIAARAREGARN